MISISIATAIAGLGIGVIVGRLTSGAAGLRFRLDRDLKWWESRYNALLGVYIPLATKEAKRLKQCKAAAAKGRAVHLENLAAARDRETELRNERHAEMRAMVGDLV